MTSGMSGLREIRQSIEALPPEARPEAPTSFAIVSVPNGYQVDANGGFERMPMLTIEHNSREVVPPEPPIIEVNQDVEPKLTPLEARLMTMSHNELMQLARELNVGE